MKTYNNLYKELCSIENLELAFRKARKRKSNKEYVIKFEKNLKQELNDLKYELESLTYKLKLLKRFIIRDPKTRTIHASTFRDRVVYHALINILEPIFDKIFIYDSYANRINKGTHKAVMRFDEFKRKISKNNQLVNNAYNNNMVKGYALKADIKHYFDTVDHKILIRIIERKIIDNKIIWLIKQILNNFDTKIKGKGMPLGNLTSQFFANVYLNELDYFIKHKLKARYYIRYVDDFIILYYNKNTLEFYKQEINNFLKNNLKLELHPDKSKIIPLRNGITLLGYRIFAHYKLLIKRNISSFKKRFQEKLNLYENGLLDYDNFINSLQGWFGYAKLANTYSSKKKMLKSIESRFAGEISNKEIDRYLKFDKGNIS